MNPHLLSSRGNFGLTMIEGAHSFSKFLEVRIRRNYAVVPFWIKKEVALKEEKKATSHQKRTVNRISRGG
jgi:hypothetical protein